MKRPYGTEVPRADDARDRTVDDAANALRAPRMLHIPGCSHNSMPQTRTRPATNEERLRLRDSTSCALRLERGD
jgi:hypothetical protein